MDDPSKKISIDDLVASMGQRDLTDDGRCTGCGECCNDFLPLTGRDIVRIRSYVKRHRLKSISHFTLPLAGPAIDAMCPFFNSSAEKGHRCTIYPVRPIICRYFICSAMPGTDQEKRMVEQMMKDKRSARELSTAMPMSARRVFFPDENK